MHTYKNKHASVGIVSNLVVQQCGQLIADSRFMALQLFGADAVVAAIKLRMSRSALCRARCTGWRPLPAVCPWPHRITYTWRSPTLQGRSSTSGHAVRRPSSYARRALVLSDVAAVVQATSSSATSTSSTIAEHAAHSRYRSRTNDQLATPTPSNGRDRKEAGSDKAAARLQSYPTYSDVAFHIARPIVMQA